MYPEKPAGSAYGALSGKGRQTGFEGLEGLDAHVCSSRESVAAVWTPEAEHMVPPEAVAGLLEALRKRFLDLAALAWADARRNTIIFALVVAWTVAYAVSQGIPPKDSQNVGLAGILLLVLGLIPLYESWKSRRSAWELGPETLAGEAEEARFDYWLHKQRVPVTIYLLFLMLFAGVAQIWTGLDASLGAAGLVKDRYAGGEWWRLLTAPFLHGNPLHWILNAAALWYLGRRAESLARWPHLALSFLLAMVTGGLATAHYIPDRPSLGASGGVLGVLGLLMVFELLHARLVPRAARRRLAAGVVATFVIGGVGYLYIDNAAHAGGLLGGMAYGLIVFPRSRSPQRPRATRTDLVAGGLALLVLTASSLLAFILMLLS